MYVEHSHDCSQQDSLLKKMARGKEAFGLRSWHLGTERQAQRGW
jgi:hypothetical protein